VKDTFAAIWGTEELLVSFDGGNAFRPWRYKREWLTDGGWYHVDQNALKPGHSGRVCVQGLVTLCDVTQDSGGLVVIPRSHTQHEDLSRRVQGAETGSNLLVVERGDPVLESGACLVLAKAGDLLLWDSRTVHCNTPSPVALAEAAGQQDEEQATASPEQPAEAHGTEVEWALLRQVGYVCMTPKAWASEDTLEQRGKAYIEGTSTNHWPHLFQIGGFAVPGTEPNDPDAATPVQQGLIGFPPTPAPHATTSDSTSGSDIGCKTSRCAVL